jgi:hypothetical protein
MFKLDYIMFQRRRKKRRRRRKKKKVEDDNLFSAQETHLLK